MSSANQKIEINSRLAKISSALISDVLDALGVRESFCGPQIHALWRGVKVSGLVATLKCSPTDKIVDDPYAGLFKLYEVIQPGDVIVIESLGFFFGENNDLARSFRKTIEHWNLRIY